MDGAVDPACRILTCYGNITAAAALRKLMEDYYRFQCSRKHACKQKAKQGARSIVCAVSTRASAAVSALAQCVWAEDGQLAREILLDVADRAAFPAGRTRSRSRSRQRNSCSRRRSRSRSRCRRRSRSRGRQVSRGRRSPPGRSPHPTSQCLKGEAGGGRRCNSRR